MNWGALARAALYGYLGVSALREARGGGRRRRGLGDRDDPSDEPRARNYDAKNIGQRVKHIVGLIQRGRGDPKVKGVAISAVSQKCGRDWCIPERDYAGEVRAIFAETRKRVRYVYDARGIDQYVAAKRTMQWGGGDCDDYSIVLGSLLGAIGYPVRLRVIRTHDAGLPRGEFNHIYALVGLPPNAPQKWIPLDASVSEPAGWEAPREMVAEYKDYEVP